MAHSVNTGTVNEEMCAWRNCISHVLFEIHCLKGLALVAWLSVKEKPVLLFVCFYIGCPVGCL